MTPFVIALGVLTAIYVIGGLFFISGLFLPARRSAQRMDSVSVIIAARNEEAEIRACVESVLNQTYSSYEVIVVDDRSEDRTAEIVREIHDPRLKVVTIRDVPPGVSGKKFALQEAVRQAAGEILLFTDADCRVPPTWVETMAAYFDERIGFVIGFSEIRASTWFEKFQRADFLTLMMAACGSANWGVPMAASGQNLAYRKKAYEEAGGFAPILHRISGDDVLMMHQIRRTGRWKILFASDTRSFVTTRPEPSIGSFLRQRTRWASNSDIMVRMSPVFFGFLASVYGFHALIAVGLALASVDRAAAWATAFALTQKFIVDALASYLGARHFRRTFSPIGFGLWFVVQTPYTLLVGLRGLFKQFHWR